MKLLSITFVALLVTGNIFAKELNPAGKFTCRTSFYTYDYISSFDILPLNSDGNTRDLDNKSAKEISQNACKQNGSLISCSREDFAVGSFIKFKTEITVDLNNATYLDEDAYGKKDYYLLRGSITSRHSLTEVKVNFDENVICEQ